MGRVAFVRDMGSQKTGLICQQVFCPHPFEGQDKLIRIEVAAACRPRPVSVIKNHNTKPEICLSKSFPGLLREGIRIGPVKKRKVILSDRKQKRITGAVVIGRKCPDAVRAGIKCLVFFPLEKPADSIFAGPVG